MIGPVVLSVFPLMALAMALRGLAGWNEVGDRRFFGALAGGGLGAAGFAILIVRSILATAGGQPPSLPIHQAVSVLLAPPVEEALKAGAILLVASVFPWDDRRIGLVVGATAGLAFAMTENVHFFVRAGEALAGRSTGSTAHGPLGFLVAFLPNSALGVYVMERLLLVSVMHGVGGSWLGAAMTGRGRARALPLVIGVLGAAVFLHAGWNACAWLDMRLPFAKSLGALVLYSCAMGSAILFVLSPRTAAGSPPP